MSAKEINETKKAGLIAPSETKFSPWDQFQAPHPERLDSLYAAEHIDPRIKSLEKSGMLLEAAALCLSLTGSSQGKKYFKEAFRLAELMEAAAKYSDAAAVFSDLSSLAGLAGESESKLSLRSAENYERAAGQKKSPEESSAQINYLGKAASEYEEAGEHEKAADCYEKAGDWQSAAEALQQLLEKLKKENGNKKKIEQVEERLKKLSARLLLENKLFNGIVPRKRGENIG